MDRSMLARATEGTDAPTPGFLYVDLAKAASANPTACQEMAQYLTRRLASKNNPNIKFKCCKVIAKLAESVPRNHFRRCIAQDASAVSVIKEATQFRGTPDPVRGDQPNQKVRDAAKEALDAVYREAPSSEQAYASSVGGNISASYAPSPYAANAGGYGGGGGGRMEGIGNPRYPSRYAQHNHQHPTNFVEAVKEAKEVVVGMIKDPLARNIDTAAPYVPRQGHSGDLPGYGHNRSQQYGRPPPGSAELARDTGGQWTMASNRGPAAVQHHQEQTNGAAPGLDSYYKERDTSFQWAQRQGNSAPSGAVGGSWASAGAAPVPNTSSVIRHPHSHAGLTMSSMPGSGAGQAASDGSYEKNLVLELCPPGGMKAVPPPDKLADFARSVSSLNSDFICPVLLDCLEDGQPWIIRAKALCVMETCIQSGTKPDQSNPYRDFFHACLDEIAPLSHHPRAAISQPASRVLDLLGVAAGSTNGGAAPPLASPPLAAAPNLLDFDDTPQPPASQPQPPATQAVAQSTMFGGMQVKSAGTATATSSAAPPPPPSSGDLLGDFGAAMATTTTTTTPVTSLTPAVNGMNNNNNATAPPSDMFAQMNLKSGVAASNAVSMPASSDPATQPLTNNSVMDDLTSLTAPSGGSAFGFINESAPKDGGTGPSSATAHHHQQQAKQNPESFDPLMNVTPTQASHRKTMQMSPEQLQAMAYQQQVFQMQQQQMQMMLAMQGAGRMPVPLMFPAVGMAVPGQQQQQQQRLSLMDTRPAKKDDKKFDFVKDAMHTAGQKK